MNNNSSRNRVLEISEFNELELNLDNPYKSVLPSYKLIDGSVFYMELNFYTQLQNIKLQYREYYEEILNSIFKITSQLKSVYFVADFDHPLLDLENTIYRDINDVLGYNKLTFDLKINPESEWKD